MYDYCYSLAIANEDEFAAHIENVMKNGDGKSELEILEEIFAFDFKYEFIRL